jgi:hypothetical protein
MTHSTLVLMETFTEKLISLKYEILQKNLATHDGAIQNIQN